jgi:enamine deaminase RidA (YjgF/YER057c/UK114 family)
MKVMEHDVDLSRARPAETIMNSAAQLELEALGALDREGRPVRGAIGIGRVPGRDIIPRYQISSPDILNEAYDYGSAFTRGLRVELPGATMLLLSGTASIDEEGRTVHEGDLEAQCMRTYRNLTRLLAAEGASWHDVVRTTCYLRDIERDYDVFNRMRTYFFRDVVGLDPVPASTGIQVRLCRSDLLVEIELMAIIPKETEGE